MPASPLDRLPFLVAHPVRSAEIAADPADRLGRTEHALELAAVTVGVLVLGWDRTRNAGSSGPQAWHRAMESKGVTLGGWVTLLLWARKEMTRIADDPVARPIALAAREAAPRLEAFTPQRNRHAHGGTPRLRSEVVAAGDDLQARLALVIEDLAPLGAITVGLVLGCSKVADGYACQVQDLRGSDELSPSRRLVSGQPYDAGDVIAFAGESLGTSVLLSPYCRWHRCSECGRDELFYLHKKSKNKNHHYSFTTGHRLDVKEDGKVARPVRHAAFGMEPIGSRRAFAARGWRARWPDLASPGRRVLSRALDTTAVLALGLFGGATATVLGGPAWLALLLGFVLAASYEPLAVAVGPQPRVTPGKRLLRLQPISAFDRRPLGRADAFRRAAWIDLQLLVPPLLVRNLTWLFADPARQCRHDRAAASVVVVGLFGSGAGQRT